MTLVKPLPRAMLIDMDDTILSAYGRPEIAWNTIAEEFAEELAPLPPQQVAAAVLAYARNFWSTAEAAWRMRLGEARRLTVRGIDQRQRSARRLQDGRLDEPPQIVPCGHLAVLPRRLEAERVRERPGRKGRVDELPDEHVLHGLVAQNRK